METGAPSSKQKVEELKDIVELLMRLALKHVGAAGYEQKRVSCFIWTPTTKASQPTCETFQQMERAAGLEQSVKQLAGDAVPAAGAGVKAEHVRLREVAKRVPQR